ncbi:hypothetical protein [Halobaculum lipolyticum]|uniref:CHAT domain-containing protein n=1 Tax=Halobaculum lipolyticum TaxID=3032001 RepID=A0ABD5WAX6_9EURY|nr:hypothetical protein [Halobaculum sp. DT31]
MTRRERESPPPSSGPGVAADRSTVDADPDAAVGLVATADAGPAAYELVDSIEEVRLPVAVGGGGRPASASPARRVPEGDRFPAPVDGCWHVDATAVTPLCTADVYVRRPDNSVVATATAEAPARVPPGPHVLELSTAPVKTYVALEGPARVSYENRYPCVSLVEESGDVLGGGAATALGVGNARDDRSDRGDRRGLLLGARSRRTSPAGTVTVPDTPAGFARAISTFGSALATTSPERSFPTLRGHPPLLERGESFEAPPLVERVDTGMTLGVPYSYEALYSATPLAFYLACEVVESDAPYLRAGEVRHDLPSDPDALATTLGELLRHCFTLDCATRACSAGLYDVELDVHETLTERLDPPWEEWYAADLPKRTAAYLEVPTAATLDCLDWPQTTDVTPVAENAPVLPFLAADLSVVRSPPPKPTTSGTGGVDDLDEFVRATREAVRGAALTRSASDGANRRDLVPDVDALVAGDLFRNGTQNAADDSETVVTPHPADSIAQSWVGPGYPMGAAKPTVEAYRRRLDRTPAEDLTIGVTVVCNDEAMIEELGDTYGFRDHVTFDIREERDLTVAELRDLLADDHDFFHYVGHVDERGMECADGWLDLRGVDDTGVDAFLLNACSSYRQGMALVDAGALGGVVSLTDLPNSLATRVGRDLARLFDAGFPLYAALDVVGTGPFAGNAYSIVGDPLVQLCQSQSGVGSVFEIRSVDPEASQITFVSQSYPTRAFGIGTMSHPAVSGITKQYISSGPTEEITADLGDFSDCLNAGRTAVRSENQLFWAEAIDRTWLVERHSTVQQ